MFLRQWWGFISAKESLCNKLKFSNSYIFKTWWCKPFILALNVDFLIQQKSWDICKVYVIKFQIYIGIRRSVFVVKTHFLFAYTDPELGSQNVAHPTDPDPGLMEAKRRLQNKFSSAVLFWIIIIHLDWFNNKNWMMNNSTDRTLDVVS